MTDQSPTPVVTDEAIAYLVEHDPKKAHEVLSAQGYSLEEWKRARNAPPAVDHASGHAPADAAVE